MYGRVFQFHKLFRSVRVNRMSFVFLIMQLPLISFEKLFDAAVNNLDEFGMSIS